LNIPFVKAHGARNDFLLTWKDQLPESLTDLRAAAIAICDRNTGVGADGWNILSAEQGFDAAIQLWNSDGSRSELSGNGTRCCAAHLIALGKSGDVVRVRTGAGPKELRLLSRAGNRFEFEMTMGTAVVEEFPEDLVPGRKTVILNVGNPQCAVIVEDFDFDWRTLGTTLERHPRFPNRTNVSFVKVVDDHTLDVRFFERGAGETASSGTGSTGAAAAAVALGLASYPVRILTPAGPLDLRAQGSDVFLCGPAEIVAQGEFFLG
jgi:diaminopimelate epimerase